MRKFLCAALMVVASGAAVSADDVPPDYLAIEWRLVALDGDAVSMRATVDFSDPARLSGTAPCNRWFAARTGILPDLALGPIGATRLACPELDAEVRFLDALGSMTRAEVTGPNTLILTGDKGRSMEFARPAN